MSTSEAVLVTGASTGIGKAVVEDLRGRGVRVFAGVRDLAAVDDHPLVTPVRLDVTDAAGIAAAADTVAGALGPSRLRGVVNNAGEAAGGPLEFLDLDKLRRHLEVNVVGQLAVTQAFLPLLRERGVADPRIVFMGSISSRIALPFVGPYAASKHAVLALGESLRRELRPWGFRVAVIEPGTIATPIWGKGLDEIDAIEAGLPPRGREIYGEAIAGMRHVLAGEDERGMPPMKVARKVRHALLARRPHAEYLVGADARQMAVARKLVPAPVLDRLVAAEVGRRGRG